jgi:hypothetical protein
MTDIANVTVTPNHLQHKALSVTLVFVASRNKSKRIKMNQNESKRIKMNQNKC